MSWGLCLVLPQGPPRAAHTAGGLMRVRVPSTSRALGEGHAPTLVPILFVQSFLERPAEFWGTESQPPAEQANRVTDVKQLFPERSAKRPRSWRPFPLFSEA